MRRTLRLPAVLAAAALIALPACSGSSSVFETSTTAPPATTTATSAPSTTVTTAAPPTTTTTTTTPPAVMPAFADDGEPIALDPVTTMRRLDNGLTYYVRENDSPGGRAQLRLVVRAGSANETSEQVGVAHFLEHMLFNGTAAYPGNELTAVLESFGAEVGPDINAYTSYEETVYSLDLPADDPAIIETGLDILFQWATAATLDPGEVDRERGVLVEEWRLNSQGFWGRYEAGVTDLLLAGTPYAGRLPLAAPEQVEAVTPGDLEAFYRSWYRPSLMAVVAVGDFTGTDIAASIEERFAGITDPADPPVPPELFTLAFPAPQPLVLADPEAPFSFVELNYPVPADGAEGTIGTVRRGLAAAAAFQILATRLHEDTLRGLTPFYEASGASNEFVRTQRTDGSFAWTDPEDLGASVSALLLEVERARRYGFTQAELDRAAADARAAVDGEYEQEGSKQDWDYAADCVAHFLSGAPASEAQEWRDLQLRLIDELTVEQVGATFAATIEATHPLVIVAGPEAESEAIPAAGEVRALAGAEPPAELPARPADPAPIEALMEAPDPADAAFSTLPETMVPVLEFENGLRFVYLPTEIHEGHVELVASSPGGWAALDPADAAEAQLIGDLMGYSGVAAFDQVSLERYLAGTEVSFSPYIDESWEGFSGTAATDDLETLFQLAHLYASAPRFDPVAVGIVQRQLEQAAEHPETLVDLALEMEIADARFSGDPRFAPLPPAEELAALDLGRAESVFSDRFADPGDFVFALVGDFDPNDAEELAARYLGTLPGAYDPDEIRDVRPPAPEGVVTRTVEAGAGERGAVVLQFGTELDLTPVLRVHLDILEAVINVRLLNHIREELSASYAPAVTIDLRDEPTDGVDVTIRVDGDPAALDTVVAAVLADLTDLTGTGPTQEEFAAGQEQVLRNYELLSNSQVAEAMLFSAWYPEELLLEIITRYERAGTVTRWEVRDAARLVLPLDAYVQVELVPIGFSG